MKTLAQQYPALGSSQNPEHISLFLKGLTALIVSLAALKGVEIDQATLLDTLVQVVASITTIISAVATFWGFIRKFKPVRDLVDKFKLR